METVAIVGVGLIGASFGLALRLAGFAGRIIGVSSPSAVTAALAIGAISEQATLEDAATAADLIYLSQPVDRILQTIEVLGQFVRPGCLVTDAGSTKAAIVTKAAVHLPVDTFLGGHPMAGKEKTGTEFAEHTLFRNRPYVLTPSGDFTPRMMEFKDWLARMEAKTIVMSAAEHDSVVALTSHVPQLLSTALCLTLARKRNPEIVQVFGPGLLDMTRLAMSSADLWESILQTNRGEILSALQDLSCILRELRDALDSGAEFRSLFGQAQEFSRLLRKVSN